MTDNECLEILYSALRSEYGITVQCPDIERAKSELYKAKRESQDAAFACIQIRNSPRGTPGELWILSVKETKDAPE